MRIGVVGPGLMGEALATQWARAGHEVVISGRTPAKARALAERIGPRARHGSIAEAVAFGEVVLPALRHEGVLSTIRDSGADWRGKVVVDCTNPVEVEGFTLVTGSGPSMAEEIRRATGGRVVKAFNLCQASVWEMRPPVFDGRPLAVPLCGDDEEANAVVGRLVADLGCTPVPIGPLRQARHLEAMAAIVIGLLWRGADSRTVFNLVTA